MRKNYLYYLLICSFTALGFLYFNSQQSYAQDPTSTPDTLGVSTPLSTTPDISSTTTLSQTGVSLDSTPTVTPTTVSSNSDENQDQPQQTPTTTPDIPEISITQSLVSENSEEVVGFSLLGFGEQQLDGPFDLTSLRFGLPANWELVEGAELHLNLSIFFDSGLGGQPGISEIPNFGNSLEVLFNDEPVGTIPITKVGQQIVTIPITTSALEIVRDDGRYQLDLVLNSSIDCQSGQQLTVVVYPDSYFVFPHQIVSPTTDLRLLPRPIYQSSFLTETMVIVIPDHPAESEMKAALTTVMGFGKMTGGRVGLALIPLSQLTEDIQQSQHLIFVGNAADFPLLTEVPLPAPVKNSNFEAPEALPDDGIIQMSVSPWNDSKVILVVGGNTDQGVVKAGQAISVGNLRTTTQRNLALIAEVNVDGLMTDTSPIIDKSLAELGYSSVKLDQVGTNGIEYQFELPEGYIGGNDSYFDLAFNHSSLLDYEQSGVEISLNGETIGSLRFDDESESLNIKRLNIPRVALLSGLNLLNIQAELEPLSECYNRNLDSIWFTIWSESQLHISLQPVEDQIRANFRIIDYPEPFALNPATLNDTTFVLAPNNPTAWNIAAQLASDLGWRVKPVLPDFAVIYDGIGSEGISEDNHLILIGRPSQLPLISQLKDSLPAPFEAGSDIAAEKSMLVQPRIPPETSLGYLELFPAPWNRSQVILTILGSTDQGLQWAGLALTTFNLRRQLHSNFAVIDNEIVAIGDIRFGFDDLTVNANTNTEDGTPLETAGTESGETNNNNNPALSEELSDTTPLISDIAPVNGRPTWVLPVLIGSIILMVIIVGIVIISSWQRGRRPVN